MREQPLEGARHSSLAFLVGGYAMLGPFSISTYMPFFPALMMAMGASQAEIQQTLSAYLAAFGFMMLLHGPLSDAFGRRRIILVGLAVYLAASLGAALASSVVILLLFRMAQGLAVGAGSIAGRATVRDTLEGPRAQRVLAHVQMIFAIAPAVAPLLGGWLARYFPWQSVFIFMAALAALLLAFSWLRFPESLALDARTSFRPRALFKGYLAVLRSRPFWLLTAALSFNFAGFFLYVASAPVFVLEFLGLGRDQFGWLFIPATAGVMLGAYISGRLADRLSSRKTVTAAYAVMITAAALNVGYHVFLPPVVPWVILPVMLFSAGMAMASPTITLATMDLFPRARGMVSSVQGFLQTLLMTLISSFGPTAVGHSGQLMAITMMGFTVIGLAVWFLYVRDNRAGAAPTPVSAGPLSG